jgi:hypothetical protein
MRVPGKGTESERFSLSVQCAVLICGLLLPAIVLDDALAPDRAVISGLLLNLLVFLR